MSSNPLTHGESSDASGSAESDGHLGPLDDYRDLPSTTCVPEHLLERGDVRLDVLVVDDAIFFCVVLTGRDRVGSRVFAEDDDFLCHTNSLARGS